MAHTLKILSFHDAQAFCSCGKWSYSFTGQRTHEQIKDQFILHLNRRRPFRFVRTTARWIVDRYRWMKWFSWQ